MVVHYKGEGYQNCFRRDNVCRLYGHGESQMGALTPRTESTLWWLVASRKTDFIICPQAVTRDQREAKPIITTCHLILHIRLALFKKERKGITWYLASKFIRSMLCSLLCWEASGHHRDYVDVHQLKQNTRKRFPETSTAAIYVSKERHPWSN